MQTIQYRKSKISEMKEDEYTKKPCQESDLCNISYAEIFGNFTQIFKALSGRRKPTETCF